MHFEPLRGRMTAMNFVMAVIGAVNMYLVCKSIKFTGSTCTDTRNVRVVGPLLWLYV